MTIDSILHRVEIVGPKFREFNFGGEKRYKRLAKRCVDMDKACHTPFKEQVRYFYE